MTEQYLAPLVLGDKINSELRQRKSKDIFKTITGSTKKIVDEKVKLEEEDGWRVHRKNAKSTRMAKSKPTDEQLEDEVWSILAQMGFKEMSKGRNFTIAVEDGLPPRQIDVFAKDDESIIIVECTRCEEPSKKSMAGLTEKIKAIRESIHKSVQKEYGRHVKLKVKFIIATRNISWRENDLAKCEEAQIAVITDGELNYYATLVQHLKHAARYQFLGHMFGGKKIEGLAQTVVATRGKMGGNTFYTFLIPPDDLLKIAYVGHKASRDIENLETYQRMLQPRRLKKIAEYINNGGRFPTNIVLNFKTTKKKSKLKFEVKEGQEAFGVLHVPPNYASAWIIDGQHRLYGYAYAREKQGFNKDSSVLPVLAFENLSAEEEMNLFIEINSKQVKVNTGLLVELYADLHWNSSDKEEAFQALLSRIASRLNSDHTSPLHDRMVVTGKRKTQFRCLTQTSIRDGLKASKLLGVLSNDTIIPGPLLTNMVDDHDASLKKSIGIISECLRMFAFGMPDHWKIGDGLGGYICTNNSIRALFHVLKDITDHIRWKEGTELYLFNADDTFNAVKPYLQVLVEYFIGASPQEILAFRRTGSSLTAVKQQAWGMEAQINKKIQDFNPPGLSAYLESRDEAGTDEAATKVKKIHKRLSDYIINTLRRNYGTQSKAWWTQGVPVKIRQDCSTKWEAANRKDEEESYLYLIHYVEICRQNWSLVKDVISLDEKDIDNKEKRTKWIRDLNEIRNITAHPERGVLTTNQVKFVNEINEKVERCFPAEGAQS